MLRAGQFWFINLWSWNRLDSNLNFGKNKSQHNLGHHCWAPTNTYFNRFDYFIYFHRRAVSAGKAVLWNIILSKYSKWEKRNLWNIFKMFFGVQTTSPFLYQLYNTNTWFDFGIFVQHILHFSPNKGDNSDFWIVLFQYQKSLLSKILLLRYITSSYVH